MDDQCQAFVRPAQINADGDAADHMHLFERTFDGCERHILPDAHNFLSARCTHEHHARGSRIKSLCTAVILNPRCHVTLSHR